MVHLTYSCRKIMDAEGLQVGAWEGEAGGW